MSSPAVAVSAAPAKPKPIRRDPSPRPTHGTHRFDELKSKDPDRRYVLANPDLRHDVGGPDYYQYLGYEPEVARPGGVHFSQFQSQNGQAITLRGQVLMSVSEERAREIDEFGPDGTTGQALADRIEAQMRDKKKGPEAVSGMLGRGGPISLTNEIEEAELE